MKRTVYRIMAIVLTAAILIVSSGCDDTRIVSHYEAGNDKVSGTSSLPCTNSTSSKTPVRSSEPSGEASPSSSVPPTSVIEAPPVNESSQPPESQPQLDEYIRSGIVYDVTRQQILFSKKPDERVYPASLVKLVTAATALKYTSKDTVFTVGTEQRLVHPHSSLCLIQKGHRLTLEDLLYGMLMASGNDAAYTIAVNVARTTAGNDMTDQQAVSYFCELMNQLAAEQGMSNSHFTNPDGWDDDNQYSTASDLLKIAGYVQNNAVINEIVSCDKKRVVFASGQNITWKNTNLLLNKESEYYDPHATGMKTGTTDKAGRCLISSAKKGKKTIIVIGLGSGTDKRRYQFASQILDKLFRV